MKVSVVVIAYNIEKYINRCLDSLINQTFKEIEIIVINDGSTDNTLNIINKYIDKDNRVILHNQENKGAIEARKSGFNISKGEYILFVDGDDWLQENTIEILHNTVINDKQIIDIVLFNFLIAYEDKSIEAQSFKIDKDSEDLLKKLFMDNVKPSIWSKFIRREFIQENDIKFPNSITYAEDLALTTSLFINKPKYKLCNKHLYNYYQRNDSITKVVTRKSLDVSIAIEFIKSQLIKHNIFEYYKYEYEFMVFKHLFYYRLLMFNSALIKNKELHKRMFIEYKKMNIDIKNNYIQNSLKEEKNINRVRVYFYHKNYYLGYFFDVALKPLVEVRRIISKG